MELQDVFARGLSNGWSRRKRVLYRQRLDRILFIFSIYPECKFAVNALQKRMLPVSHAANLTKYNS